MNKKIILILIFIGLLTLSCCSATIVNIQVSEKHILGAGGGDYSDHMIFIIVDNNHNEYLVQSNDYYKVNVRDTVKLALPGDKQSSYSRDYCQVI